jgi:hypothetical protein
MLAHHQPACAWRQVARSQVHEHPMCTSVDVQVSVRRRDIVYRQTALPKDLLDLRLGHVGKQVSRRVVDAAVADGETLKIP